MRTRPAALTLPGENSQICNSALRDAPAREAAAAPGARSARHQPRSLRAAAEPALLNAPRVISCLCGTARPGPAPAADTQPGTMNFCIAVLLLLHALPGKYIPGFAKRDLVLARCSGYSQSYSGYYYCSWDAAGQLGWSGD